MVRKEIRIAKEAHLPYLVQITHESALSSDKYGGQLTSVSSPEHDADTGCKSPPKKLPVAGLEVTDSGLSATHT